MAYEKPGFDHTFEAGADLSALQYHFVKLNSSKQIVAISAVTDIPIGILQDTPNAAGKAANVMMDGISKLKMAAANAVPNLIGPSADGRGAVYVNGTDTTKYIVGTVIQDADAENGIGTVAFSCLTPNRGA